MEGIPFSEEEASLRTSHHQDEGSSKRGKELFLDTKGTCFLCLEDTSGAGDDENGVGIMSEFCLRNICRYLKINPCLVLVKSMKGYLLEEWDDEKGGVSGLKEKCDFSVMLCSNCSSLAKKMSELIRQAEMTEMLLKHHLQKLEQIFTSAEESSEETLSRLRRFREKMSTCANPVEAGLVENLRLETKENCLSRLTSILRTSFPKLSVPRVKLPDREKPRLTRLQPPNDTKIIENSCIEPENEASLTDDHDDLPVPEVNTDSPAASALGKFSPKEWVQDLCSMQCRKYPGKRLQCPYCKAVRSDANMRQHLLLVHFDKCFAHMRLPETNELVFKKHCRVIVRQEKENATKSQSTSKGSPYLCVTCNRKFAAEIGFKYHFILQHYSILEEKLLKLQGGVIQLLKTSNPAPTQPIPGPSQEPPQMPGTSVKTMISSEPLTSKCPVSSVLIDFCKNVGTKKRTSDRFQCALCPKSKKLYPEMIINQHLVNVHPEKFFESLRLPSVEELHFHNCCKQVLKVESTRSARAQCRNAKCPVCRKKFIGGGSYRLRYHLVTEHYDFIKEKVLSFQGEEVSKTGQQQIQNIFSKFCEQFERVEEYTREIGFCCGICKSSKKPEPESTVHRHLINTHPEILFADKLLEGLSEEKFALCCKNALAIETRNGIKSTSEACQYACQYCEVKDFSYSDLKHHLIMNHYHILEGTLKSLQEETIRGGQENQAESTTSGEANPLPAAVIESTPRKRGRPPKNRLTAAERKIIMVRKPKRPNMKWSQAKNRWRNSKKWTCDTAEGGCGRNFCSIYYLKKHQNTVCSNFQSRITRAARKAKNATNKLETPTVTPAKLRLVQAVPPLPEPLVEDSPKPLKRKRRDKPKENLEKLGSIPPRVPKLPKKRIKTSSSKQETVAAPTSSVTSGSISKQTEGSAGKQFVLEVCQDRIENGKPGNASRCSICNLEFPLKHTRNRAHLVTSHPELFFEHLKPPTMTKERFRDCCIRWLRKENLKARKLIKANDSSSNQRKVFCCVFCKKQYTNPQDNKLHMVSEHYEEVEEKLMGVVKTAGMKTSSATARKQDPSAGEQSGGAQTEKKFNFNCIIPTVKIAPANENWRIETSGIHDVSNDNLEENSIPSFPENSSINEPLDEDALISPFEEMPMDNFSVPNDIDHLAENEEEEEIVGNPSIKILGTSSMSYDVIPWNNEAEAPGNETIENEVQPPPSNASELDFRENSNMETECTFECSEVEIKPIFH